MTDRVAVKVSITGKVQGVGYRAWCAAEAEKLDLHGFVRNRIDGSVEALFVGPQLHIDAILKACDEGPVYAAVESVTVQEAKGLVPPKFQVKPTV
ncbi:acylphosphatase [Kordiimonas laminariae]|uniref:acylphosphatase n=1 Tax=Kordiimonas laminariae TaxID=2917717 RepID=UPI001FF31ECC|nr:acylphosphatase [Kordiimonas laminariae]MCK0069527.1 acylphosphatase [Kordiimonas laminariae]